MSRNGHFALHGSLATAYAPDAERSAEGDILGVSAYDLSGLREDDAAVRLGVSAYDLRGLREDDAAVRMGVSAYDLAGLREDDAAVRMGVSAYDLRGLREDDAAMRLGVSAYDLGDTRWDGATGDAEGSAEGHAVAQLGILVSNGRVGGMVEDHWGTRMGVSAYDLSGLREDDAAVRLGTAYAEDAAGSAEDPVGRAGMGVSAYDLGRLRSRRMGPRYGTEYSSQYGTEYGGRYRGAGYMKGLREDDASVRLGDVDSLNAEAWAIEQHGRISGLVENFRMGYILRGLREDDAEVRLRGLREDDASVRIGVSAYDLGRRRAFTYSVDGAEEYPPAMLAADGFHERFPVNVPLRGLGRMRGIFDFLKPNPTWEEFVTRAKDILYKWNPVKDRIMALPSSSKAAVLNQMAAAHLVNVDNFDRINGYLIEGPVAYQASASGHNRSLDRLDAYLPTLTKVVTQMESLPGGVDPSKAANQIALDDVNKRISELGKPTFMTYAVPIGAGVVAASALTALVVAIAK